MNLKSINIPAPAPNMPAIEEKVDLDLYYISEGKIEYQGDERIPDYRYYYEAYAINQYRKELIENEGIRKNGENRPKRIKSKTEGRRLLEFSDNIWQLLIATAKIDQLEKSYNYNTPGEILSIKNQILGCYEDMGESYMSIIAKEDHSPMGKLFDKLNSIDSYDSQNNLNIKKSKLNRIISEEWYKRKNCCGILFNIKKPDIPVLISINGKFDGIGTNPPCIEQIEKVFGTQELEWIFLNDAVEYLFDFRGISYYDYKEYLKVNECKENNRMFTCVERKLLTKYIEHKYDYMIVQKSPCYMCQRSMNKFRFPEERVLVLDEAAVTLNADKYGCDAFAKEIWEWSNSL